MGKRIPIQLSNGEYYESLTKVCKRYKISRKAVMNRLNQGMSIDEAINSTHNQIEYNGIVYKNKTDLARAFGLSYGQLKGRLNQGMSIDEALHYDAKELKTYNIVSTDGISRNIKEICNELGISQNRVYYIAKKRGISPVEVIKQGLYDNVQHQEKYRIECMLGVFNSIAKLAKKCNLIEATIKQRIKSNIDVDAALVVPAINSKENNIKMMFCGLDGKAYYKVDWNEEPVTTYQIIEHYRPDLLETYKSYNPTGEYRPYKRE